MVEAARDGGFGVALFVGYHARAGHPRGTIAHTYSGSPTLTSLNGRPVGEYGINALYLGALGVPVGLVAGDDALADEVAGWLPWAERVVVKRAVGGRAADSLHPSRARDLIREASASVVRRAIEDGETFRPLTLEAPIRVAVDFASAAQADYAALTPGAVRDGDRGVQFETDDPVTAYRAFVVFVRLAGLVK
jgi:D-amino peptidase